MSLEILRLELGVAQTNAYLVADTMTRRAVLIDPVDDAPRLVQAAETRGWTIALILATHAHFDHVLASRDLKTMTSAPFYIHADCLPWLEALPVQGMRFGLGAFPEAAAPDRLLGSEPEVIELDGISLETLYTPGHAPGHLAFFLRSENVVFSGDALFAGSIGRTDLPGGDYPLLMRSIFDKLIPLGDDVRVLSGHGPATTIGRERRINPFLLNWRDDEPS
ncbi:MAG: MBL fold metallo-hydrolase [Anaerolineae bacterium]|nr:MBL fold metallo-hydrolase [Anaerolineae bacterium]MDW8173186.1 MBL fold metallo-hydrolase [Anaerolineae bacterium]